MLDITLSSTITKNGISIVPRISIIAESTDFTPKPIVEDPIVSTMGLVVATGVIVALLVEYFIKILKS